MSAVITPLVLTIVYFPTKKGWNQKKKCTEIQNVHLETRHYSVERAEWEEMAASVKHSGVEMETKQN